jgi:ATP-dependent HslUV protease subunit HslV
VTTVVYRDGCLAADTLLTSHTHRDGYVTKIRKRGPFLAGASGTWPFALAFLDWFSKGLPEDRKPTMQSKDAKDGASGYIFRPDGLVLTFTAFGWTWKRAPFYAFGSGADYAYGAMTMGATAEEAVRAALVHETASGGPITVLRHW